MKLFVNKNRVYLLASLAGAIATIGLTLLIYMTFFQKVLENFNELSPDVVKLISREHLNLSALLLSNLAHGFLIATVFRWGKFYTPLRGAGAGATIAFFTDIYFCFNQYALFKTMSATAAILDTFMWMFINAIVGALVAWILRRAEQKN